MSDSTKNLAELKSQRVELAAELQGLLQGELSDDDLAKAEEIGEQIQEINGQISDQESRSERIANLNALADTKTEEVEEVEVEAELTSATGEVEETEAEETEESEAEETEADAEVIEISAEADADADAETAEADADAPTAVAASAAATTDDTQEASMPDNTVNATEALDAVVASGASAENIVAAATTTEEVVVEETPALTITASANVPGMAVGETLDGIEGVAKALANHAGQMPEFRSGTGRGGPMQLHKFSTASIQLSIDDDLMVKTDSPGEFMKVIDYAGDESRLAGGNLTAAGWCAPSDNVLDICPPASLEGMLDLPEFGVTGGGVNHASGPDFASLFGAGFTQTEAEAIAGDEKECIEIPCPTFTETRLDADGLCIKGGLLMRAAYPQWVEAFVARAIVAHRHYVNQLTINKVVAGSTARTITGVGTSAGDTLDALALIAAGEREKFRLGLRQTLEVAVPFWVEDILIADLSKRVGASPDRPVTTADVAAHFAARKLRVQYLHDWDSILPGAHGTTPAYPATFRALVYPAGTWKRAVKPVINLSTVYDSASLTVNQYLGLFMEQGSLTIKSCYDSFVITVPVCNAGRTGANDITCGDALGTEDNPVFMQTVTP